MTKPAGVRRGEWSMSTEVPDGMLGMHRTLEPHGAVNRYSPLQGSEAMWILLWGDSSNEATGDWHREEHETSDEALAAARTKISEGQIAHAIHSPAGILWMRR
jgi:hypothetical protein